MICNLRACGVAVALALVLGCVLPASAITYFTDGNVHDLTGNFTEALNITDGGVPAHGTTVNMLAGSSVVTSFPYGVHVANSTLNLRGGTVQGGVLGIENRGVVNIYDGRVQGMIADYGILNIYNGRMSSKLTPIEIYPGGEANLFGGDFDTDFITVLVDGDSSGAGPGGRLNLFGGHFTGGTQLPVHWNGQVFIYGENFALDGAPVPYGLVPGSGLALGTLTGTLSDGSPADFDLAHFGTAVPPNIVLVEKAVIPEPATALLTGLALATLGCQVARRRRRGC